MPYVYNAVADNTEKKKRLLVKTIYMQDMTFDQFVKRIVNGFSILSRDA